MMCLKQIRDMLLPEINEDKIFYHFMLERR